MHTVVRSVGLLRLPSTLSMPTNTTFCSVLRVLRAQRGSLVICWPGPAGAQSRSQLTPLSGGWCGAVGWDSSEWSWTPYVRLLGPLLLWSLCPQGQHPKGEPYGSCVSFPNPASGATMASHPLLSTHWRSPTSSLISRERKCVTPLNGGVTGIWREWQTRNATTDSFHTRW